MGVSLNINRSSGKSWRILLPLALVTLPLALLFARSLQPDYVVFSNDAPFGAMMAELNKAPDILRGVWANLNWLGGPAVGPSPTVSTVLRLSTSPIWFAKLYAPFSMWFLGLSAWIFFYRLGFSIVAAALATVAATLNCNFFSSACWGVCSHPITFGAAYLALAALVGSPRSWKNVIVAGIAVGVAIMEGYDIGAIFSLYVAAFMIFQALNSEQPLGRKLLGGAITVGLVAVLAALCSIHTLSSLISTQVKGVTDEKANMTPEQRWDWATQWSMPPREFTRILIPGLYGYRMDTPKDMAGFSDWFEGGAYWGEVGQAPMLEKYIEEYHAKGNQGIPPNIPAEAWRFNGGGEYSGLLVLLVGVWAALQSFRKTDSVFTVMERKSIWFWTATALVSLLLATGRYAPFYRLFYLIPHASNIRNASKFMHPFHWSLVILFAYGVHGISKRYLSSVIPALTPAKGAPIQKRGWSTVSLFDRRWLTFLFIFVGLGLLGWVAYASNHDKLAKHLMDIGFANEGLASQMASFSVKEFGWFVLFLILTVGLLTAVFTGRLSGARAKLGAILLGTLLMLDLARADLPWIIYQNYVERYKTNDVIEFLRDKPYEHRVTAFPNTPVYNFYRVEWMQHQFQYYNIQCLDDVQRPREAADFKAFERGPLAANPVRHWELTNTRYFLGPAVWLDSINQQLDPQLRRFQTALRFDLKSDHDQITAVANTNGQYAIFDFRGALPRASLYSNWQVNTNDEATLSSLASTNFNPRAAVLLAEPVSLASSAGTNQNPGTVGITDYHPKRVVLQAKASVPCVLLLNDKYDPNWKVTVDGKPETLLRANFIMRGVALTPGDHKIEFRFVPPLTSLYVSLAAIILALALVGVLAFAKNGEPPPAPQTRPEKTAKK